MKMLLIWKEKCDKLKAVGVESGWGRTPCRENKETKFVLKVF